jgi:uncharacterized protein
VTTYLDTSVVVAIVIDEPQSKAVRAWMTRSSEQMILSELVALECAAVVTRALRTARFDESQAEAALASFDLLRAACAPHAHSPDDFELAATIVRDFSTKLAAADSLHLASTISADARLATYDERLAAAARARGVAVETFA